MTDATPGSPAAAGLSPARRVVIRLIASPLLLGTALAILWIWDRTGNPRVADAMLLLLGAGGALEMANMLRAPERPVVRWPVVLGAALLAGVGLFAPHDPALRAVGREVILAGSLVLILMVHLFDVRPQAVGGIASALVPLLYVGLLFSFTRETAFGSHEARVLGWVLVTAKASDIGGWVVGKPFGRHKLVPTVSPGKSWEGLAGGLALSVAAAVWGPTLLDLDQAAWSVLHRVAFGLAVGGASVLAGITQSGWKRRVGVKDSSPLIPEVGGVLDLIDSMLFAGPVAALWLRGAG